ncbi:error-prone DNA polymerase [Actinospica sp. MGRD01-02]|uniref:Error-prone DNA polymerase n=1 Tax=Actinospica acidithermotolerans TaxID=2828514 RepID=A0A941EGS9_9ACTN|nr:error-prone DNA polymerase [Actinospica acidithermotolerans]MBR7831212.1 error-prone DNA polymerase [Actinospica acidithermotolerans]
MGFDNPVVPWRELDKALSWTRYGELSARRPAGDEPRAPVRRASAEVPYAELHVHSGFSFLDGTSEPEALVAEAARLGLETIGLTDHDGMYGVVRMAQAARGTGVGTVFGAELSLAADRVERTGVPDPAGAHLLLLARDVDGYRSLSKAIGDAHLAGDGKGRAVYGIEELAARAQGRWTVLTGCRKGLVPRALAAEGWDAAGRELDRLRALFGRDNVAVELVDHDMPGDDTRNNALATLADRHGVATIATNQVHYATPGEYVTACALAALRARRSMDEIEGWLPAAPTAHLRSGVEMAERFARFPGILERTVELARACRFDFSVVIPGLPAREVPGEHDESSWLRELVETGARERYGPRRENPAAYRQLDYEVGVIAERRMAGYFLIVYEIAKFCRDNDILAQGRGSAANSAVCYALGITNVDPIRYDLVFERFLSPEREGYPDIDLDIESGRREEVIQHIYSRYGRDRAAQVCNVITYRAKGAVRDAARALGYAQGSQDAWSKRLGPYTGAADLASAGIPEDVLDLAHRLHGLPRHLGIHSGGMVLCDRPVAEVVPTEWARMENRSVIQWDKDDCADAGLVKFDLLGLGMLGALHDCFDLVREAHGVEMTLGTVPKEDEKVYDMLCAADSVGVFQVESRAQMATLPRLKPRKFYDLVIEIALIRPGPIQGGAVHPYLRRRSGDEKAEPPHPLLAGPLERTLGVPLFQEQVMQMAIAAANFSAAEADRLRRAMGAKRSTEKMLALKRRLLSGMAANDITGELAEDVYRKLEAFSSYGFPESHSISFAYLVYASSFLKLYYPAAFTAALLNNQPMGFYSPASLISDARRHGVIVRGVDANRSRDAATLEPPSADEAAAYKPTHPFASPHPQPAIRLGFASVRDLGAKPAERVAAERDANGPYADMEDFVRRTGLPRAALEALATAGAFGCFGLTRREALWRAGSLAGTTDAHLPGTSGSDRVPALPPMTAVEQTFADLWATGTSPESHPVAHMRPELDATGHVRIADLDGLPDRRLVHVAGIVTHRQRPPTAGGVCFLSLEDETGLVNVVCSPEVWQRYQRIGLMHGALRITGSLERSDHGGGALNIVAGRLAPLRVAAQPSRLRGRDFR